MKLREDDEELLLALLNSAPVERGRTLELLDGEPGARFAARFGGTGSDRERDRLRRMRGALHDLIREAPGAAPGLEALLVDAALVPEVTPAGFRWRLEAPEHEALAARAAFAWAETVERAPGRLRACANEECNLFLLDHSRPGTARWCSMATCGNRMKVRKHASRKQEA